MKNALYSLFFLLLSFSVFSQDITPNAIGKTVTFSMSNFKAASANFVQSNGLISKMTIQLPMPNGVLGDIVLTETLLSDKKIPTIQTFDGVSPDGKTVLKLTTFPDRVEGLMHTPDGYFIIEPLDIKKDLYLVYGMNEIPADRLKCGSLDETINAVNKNGRVLSTAPFPVGTQLRTYRLAAAATGEMTTFYTNQAGAIAQITSVMNASNLIYELEAAIHFQLTAATTGGTIIFTNGATDPFTVDPSFANAANSQAGFDAMNTSTLLTYANYDVGHTFNTLADLGGGSYSISGQAGTRPCLDGSKARGWTEWTLNSALGAIVNVFVHEVGHQFSAPHTFNAVGGPSSGSTFCTGGWSSTSAVEPGSGSTLMAYKNNCTFPNYTLLGNNGLSYFHTKSLEFINNAVANTASTQTGSCITTSATGNTPPVANAGLDVTIPKGTPFKLTGTATDANPDILSYTWDQFDVASITDQGAFGSSIVGTGVGGVVAVNSLTAPLFRSEMSSSALDRTFPKLTHILNSANDPVDNEGEDLPQVARSMKFRFTVRDNRANGGGVDSDETIVTVTNDGPFLLTSQNTSTLWIYNGTNTANITWSVNNTNLAPLSVANVKISFSTDGGVTFPITFFASTPNDGTETITIPNNVTTQGRIKIEPVGTYAFFDINNVNITISTTCTPETTSIIPSTAVAAVAGNAALSLGLSSYGTIISTISGTVDVGDTPSNLTYINPSNVCNGPSNSNYVETKTFIAGTTGSYTFTRTAAFSFIMNLYSTSFISNSVCTNFITSNGIKTVVGGSVTLNNSFTVTLTAGQKYVLTSGGFNSSSLGAYSVAITPPGGGGIYEVTPAIGSPYAYTYPVVNSAGNIVAFNDNSDLTNTTTYTPDTYTVYGLSYQGGANLVAYVGTSLTSFQALLTANTICGKLSTNSKSVIICAGLPVQPSAFTVSSGAVCQGASNVVYTVPTVAGATGYTWTYSGTGHTINGSTNSVTISFSASATSGTLSVTANNICGSSIARTLAITVNSIPVQPSAFTVSSPTVCKGANNVTYTVPAVAGATSYVWTYTTGTGATITGTSNSVTVSFSGVATSGNLNVAASNTCGNSLLRTQAIAVNTPPANPTTYQSGNWNATSTWMCGTIPIATTDATVSAGHTVTIDGTLVQVKKLINNGGSVQLINAGFLKLNN